MRNLVRAFPPVAVGGQPMKPRRDHSNGNGFSRLLNWPLEVAHEAAAYTKSRC